MIWFLMILMGLAWLVQSILGFFQIRNFNRQYSKLRSLGRVAIGKRKGMFSAGTVVMLAINKKAEIIDAKIMQGVTVFSRIKPLKGLEDKHLLKLSKTDLGKFDKLTASAIQDAVASYEVISKGGELQVKKGWIERLISRVKK